ncbi:MAG: glycosyltransferase family 4 protein [archaeon]
MSKISICCPHSGFSPHDNRGGAIYEYNILKRLVKYNVQLRAILPASQYYEPMPNLEVTRSGLPYNPALYNVILPLYINRLYKEQPFDILRPAYTSVTGPGVAIWKAITRKKIPTIVTQHHLRTNYLRIVQMAVLKRMDRIITVSPDVREVLIKEGISNDRVRFIPNGVDTEVYAPGNKPDYLLKRYQLKSEDFVVGTICGLEKRKRVDLLIKAISKLDHPKLKLFIGGRGDSYDDLLNLAKRLGVSKKVIFGNFIKKDELRDHYNLFDVYALPSDLEAMPLAILEAMACGKPAIGTKVGAIPLEISHRENGYIIEKGDLNSLVNHVKEMLSDPGLTQEMGRNSLKRVKEKFNWDHCAKQTYEVIRELVE